MTSTTTSVALRHRLPCDNHDKNKLLLVPRIYVLLGSYSLSITPNTPRIFIHYTTQVLIPFS
jgi:hypothetical protein